MHAAGDDAHGRRLRGLIVILWRAGPRIQEALALVRRIWTSAAARCSSGTTSADGAARSAWTRGAGSSCGRGSPCASRSPSEHCCVSSRRDARPPLVERDHTHRPAKDRRGDGRAPALRAASAPPRDAVALAREGVSLTVIQRQLGHGNLSITSAYLQGIDNAEIIDAVHARRAPVIPVSASLRL
jgi:hypothetical protein